jgi:hypothetical protein
VLFPLQGSPLMTINGIYNDLYPSSGVKVCGGKQVRLREVLAHASVALPGI